MFLLHPDFRNDWLEVAHLPLSQLLLKDDARFPWLVLVPRRAGMSEWFDLSPADREQCEREVMHVARTLKQRTGADKMNIAALGNITPQLHIHVIARKTGDAAWPGPVWNTGAAIRYTQARKLLLMADLSNITKM